MWGLSWMCSMCFNSVTDCSHCWLVYIFNWDTHSHTHTHIHTLIHTHSQRHTAWLFFFSQPLGAEAGCRAANKKHFKFKENFRHTHMRTQIHTHTFTCSRTNAHTYIHFPNSAWYFRRLTEATRILRVSNVSLVCVASSFLLRRRWLGSEVTALASAATRAASILLPSRSNDGSLWINWESPNWMRASLLGRHFWGLKVLKGSSREKRK